MSARVFKPILLSEMPKMRSSPSLDSKFASRGITKVRRALFNPQQEENRRFLDEELAKISSNHSDRWNFDFLAGRPIIDTTNSTAYAWIAVCPSRSSALLPQRPVKLVISQSPDITDLYPPNLNPPQTVAEDEKMSIEESSPCKETSSKQLQSKITDFLSVRKRSEVSASSTKKLTGSTTPRPRKILRLTS